jgi:hypothetical protein
VAHTVPDDTGHRANEALTFILEDGMTLHDVAARCQKTLGTALTLRSSLFRRTEDGTTRHEVAQTVPDDTGTAPQLCSRLFLTTKQRYTTLLTRCLMTRGTAPTQRSRLFQMTGRIWRTRCPTIQGTAPTRRSPLFQMTGRQDTMWHTGAQSRRHCADAELTLFQTAEGHRTTQRT